MAKNDDEKLFAFLGVFLTLIGFIIVYAAKKDSKYAMFYAKQGLILFFLWIIAWVITVVLAFIPFIGWLIGILVWLALLALWIFGIIYALSGEEKYIPVIGTFAKLIKL
ncbi:TPA: DUF4870 domain-containing protein [Candidatus Woesearchaeota archaeon]|nr:DUF4870 domain-containing protein [Candidatus Woesearchaeota archaeon]HIH31150.1 DUF4870 domain-containing protein [Candidatus Woesearchaeota archaeon]HIH54631.1 DUF4870 domain-containing protein [Candidatus Woesearchaeota archaeon]HIJ02316.1 DUF4870 domain-containing protein [Candidatus Woesearchaeota archaeon]HIJ14207.1 DUF4870 domain-containing protein [Candidatus Woesearchaeota archaeon]